MNANNAVEGYLEVAIVVPRESEELLSNFIIEEIAFGLVTEELDDEIRIICYLQNDNQPLEKLDKIKKYISLMEILPENLIEENISSKTIKEIDWIKQYQQEFKSVIMDDLVIKTPWDNQQYSQKYQITIEPKMAFGTGKHETTKLCLGAVWDIVKPGMKILDLGTGSGILSIYAAMLGANDILGVDIDPDAIPNAIENAEINKVDSVFTAKAGSMEAVPEGEDYDLVISNLIFEGITQLFEKFLSVLRPGGIMILSGILDNQNDDMIKHFEKYISADIETRQLNEWLCYIIRT